MKLTKKELLLKLRENLNEMPMTFDTPDSRPNPDVERDLANRNHTFKKVNLPKNVDEPHSNFEEFLASKRYKQIVDNVRQNLGMPLGTGEQNMYTLNSTMSQAQSQVSRIESQHKTELAALAVQLVMKELGIEEGDIVYEATIDIPNNDGFKNSPSGEMEPEEIELEKELFDELDDFTLERAKRRMINAMMQGAASKGHFMYHYVRDGLQQITGQADRLISMYGALMSAADAMLWQGSNRGLGVGGGGGTPMVAGKERAYPNENPPRVVATAINFPILVHELIKGTYEVISALHGQPRDKDLAKRVMDKEDSKNKEIWDFRLGPAIWDILKDSFPEETITDEDKVGIQLIMFQTIVSKPAKQFLIFMREVLTGSQSGKRLIKLLYDMINGEINDYDYKVSMAEFDRNLDDMSKRITNDDLKNMLSDIPGITFSSGDDEEDDDEDEDLGSDRPRR
jgi:hypothetical protein